jgi:hypothetical protein
VTSTAGETAPPNVAEADKSGRLKRLMRTWSHLVRDVFLEIKDPPPAQPKQPEVTHYDVKLSVEVDGSKPEPSVAETSTASGGP